MRAPGRAFARMARASSSVQQVRTPGRSMPGIRSRLGRDPVAMSRRSKERGRAVADVDGAGGRVDGSGAGLHQADAQPLVVMRVFANVGARFVDVPLEQIGDGHAGVWRLTLAAEHGDLCGGVGLSQGLRRDHARGTAADDDVSHAHPGACAPCSSSPPKRLARRRAPFTHRAVRAFRRWERPPWSTRARGSTPAASRRVSTPRLSAGPSAQVPSSGAAGGCRPCR